jgi:hypothetical protein
LSGFVCQLGELFGARQIFERFGDLFVFFD